jgi:hypothetical protein
MATIAGTLFLASWWTLHYGFFSRVQIIDTPTYQYYGDRMLRGDVPYKNFSVEYPPGALVAFLAPAIGNSPRAGQPISHGNPSQVRERYRRNFEFFMAACGLLAIALIAAALLILGASNGWMAAALALAALSPLLIGNVIVSRFDLWPTALAIAGLVAILAERRWLGFGLLGIATAAKIFPVVLVPVVCIWLWKREGKREVAAGLEIFGAVLVAAFLPFAIIAPGGIAHAIGGQIGRPLQIESLGAAVLVALHHLAGLHIVMKHGSGSDNLSGGGSEPLAVLQALLQIAAIVGVYCWFVRGEMSRDRLIRAGAGVLVAFIAFGKVLSPQYLIWLIPFIPLVRGKRGIAASSLLVSALVLTQLEFPSRYLDYSQHFALLPSVFVLLRDLVLVALFTLLLAPEPYRRQAFPSTFVAREPQAPKAPIRPGSSLPRK